MFQQSFPSGEFATSKSSLRTQLQLQHTLYGSTHGRRGGELAYLVFGFGAIHHSLCSVADLRKMQEEVVRVAAERPWTNYRGWMEKALERAIAGVRSSRL